LERAQLLLADPARKLEAIPVLQSVLDEEPDHPAAGRLLANLLAEAGRDDDLVDLLHRQIDLVRDRADAAAVGALSLRLGSILSANRRGEAADVYRAALAWAPENVELLRTLIGVLGDADELERADLLEQLLSYEDLESAVSLAFELADRRAALGD